MKVQVRFFENPCESCFYKRVFNNPAEALIPRKGDYLSLNDEAWLVKQVDWGCYDEINKKTGDMVEVWVEHADMNEYYGGSYID